MLLFAVVYFFAAKKDLTIYNDMVSPFPWVLFTVLIFKNVSNIYLMWIYKSKIIVYVWYIDCGVCIDIESIKAFA